ncbi:MAG TPA: tetratricopeptide repeat protein [Nitrospiria bacterium]|nr:tetratricopeptide repeat protein [Nitrospiria bacterium]HUK56813.1 tetratricopeptide repeat protein [Nitrospiria bacterium]
MKRFVRMNGALGILTVLVSTLYCSPGLAAEPTAAVSFSTQQLPAWAETAWLEYRSQRDAGQMKEASEVLTRIRGQAADLGIRGFDLPAAVMIQEGEEALSKGHFKEAVELGEEARQWSPDDPNGAFFLAKVFFDQHPFLPFAAIKIYLKGLLNAASDFWSSFYFLGRLVLILLVGLLGSFVLFFVFLLIRYLPLLVHGLHEWFRTILNRPTVWVFVLTLLFTPLLIGTSTGLILLVGLCMVWRFMTKSERLISAVFAVIMSLTVYWLPITLTWLTADRSSELMLMAQVLRGDAAASGTALQMEKGGGYDKNWPVLFSLALQKKREGNYSEALEQYQRLQKLEPNRSIILNNLGNVYFLLHRNDEAMAVYKLSLAMTPQSAATHYNLSLVYRELLRFNDAEQEYEAAQRINLPLIQSYTGHGPMDELFSKAFLWRSAFSDTSSNEEGSRKFFERVMAPLSLKMSPYLLVFFTGGVIVMRLALPRKYTAAPCTLCGRPICFQCQRRIFDQKTCVMCWRNYKSIKRKTDLRQIKTRRRWIFRTAQWISVLLPGAGHFYFGREIKGFIFQAVFIGILFAFLGGNGFLRAPTEHGDILGLGGLAMIVSGLIVLYLLVFHDILRISYEKV